MGMKEKLMPKCNKGKECKMANERKGNECSNFVIEG